MAKNIVLLSDGTGKSAAKPFKSNVWRLYQALDIRPSTDPYQIAFYDDGVGTEKWRPLAALAGAFGIGVWKNVRRLYTDLCRNYDADDGTEDHAADRIYILGFSRGAFTVRLLAGLVGKCGVVRAASETELLSAVEMAFIEYRSDFLLRAAESRQLIPAGSIREPVYADPPQEGSLAHRHSRIRLPVEQRWPEITFLGVWDTVSAYGVPIDELKDGIDHWIWPMSFADRHLSPHVLCARHALSIDDARPTFTPVLWSERTYGGEDIDPARLKQVWFAGVHSNVGGGYPDDGMAYVALDWMMGEAEQAGLQFVDAYRREAQFRADPQGRIYDSRSGLAGYYRYGPRDVERLMRDERLKVFIPRPKLHRSALERIGRRRVEYSPVSLPWAFLHPDVLTPDPDDDYVLAPSKPLPADEVVTRETQWMEFAWDAVWRRRAAYLATVTLTVLLVLFPLLFWRAAFSPPPPAGGVSALIHKATPFYLTPWVNAFMAHWLIAGILMAIVAWLFFRVSPRLRVTIDHRAEQAWALVKGIPPVALPAPDRSDQIARSFRKSPDDTVAYRRLTREVVPAIFAFTIGLIFVLPFALINLQREQWKRREWFPPEAKRYVPRASDPHERPPD